MEQSNLSSIQGLWMQHKGEGGLRNLPACSDDVNDMYFVSTNISFPVLLGIARLAE